MLTVCTARAHFAAMATSTQIPRRVFPFLDLILAEPLQFLDVMNNAWFDKQEIKDH
jgi:hypothetical protein